jgi:hypothetical protein
LMLASLAAASANRRAPRLQRLGNASDQPRLVRRASESTRAGGASTGSINATLMWWWFIWLPANGVMGEDGETVPPGASKSWGAVVTRTRAAYWWLSATGRWGSGRYASS